MDEYFQILLYLIIIFAFLNSIFKKKKKEEQSKRTGNAGPSPQQRRNNYPSEDFKGEKKEDYDILNEIEGLFRGDKPPASYETERRKESEIEKAEMRKVPVEEHTEDREWHTEDEEWHSEDEEWHSESEEWHEKSTTEHELDQSWHTITQYKRPAAVDAAIEQEAEKFERMLADRNKEVAFPFNELRKKLYSPGTLQEYVIVSEIIGKPKYLRR